MEGEGEGGGGGRGKGGELKVGGGDWAGGGAVDKDEEECKGMLESLRIVVGDSWGKATKAQQQRWGLLECDEVISSRGGRARAERREPVDCTAR